MLNQRARTVTDMNVTDGNPICLRRDITAGEERGAFGSHKE